MARKLRLQDWIDGRGGEFDLSRHPWAIPGALIALAVIVALFTSYYTVEPEGVAIVKRFGKVVSTRQPGLHFKLPFWIDRTTFVPTARVLKEEFGFRTIRAGQRTEYASSPEFAKESLMLTGDLNVIYVEWVVQYRISDADKYLHRLRNQTETIRVISEAVMRRIVGNRLGSDALTVGRVEIANLAREEMQAILATYDMGVHVQTIELQDVTPPDPVKPAFDDVNEARQQRERLINEAEKYRNKAMPRANGEAKKVVANAQGYAAERVNAAKGDAARFLAVYEEYRKEPQITRQRLYLEMIDSVLPNVGHVYIVEKGQMAPIPLLNLGQDRPAVLNRGGR